MVRRAHHERILQFTPEHDIPLTLSKSKGERPWFDKLTMSGAIRLRQRTKRLACHPRA